MTVRSRAKPLVVDVALGDRSYDIVIGRRLMGTLGGRIAALRPGAKAVIVTDENVAQYYLRATESALGATGMKSPFRASACCLTGRSISTAPCRCAISTGRWTGISPTTRRPQSLAW